MEPGGEEADGNTPEAGRGRGREREGAGLLPGGRAHNFILNGSYISYKIPAYASYFSNITNTWTFIEISVE